MQNSKTSPVLPVDLQPGDLIQYSTGKASYVVVETTGPIGKRSIKLFKVMVENNVKHYSYNPGICVINELNKKGLVSSHWTREVILLTSGHEIPSSDQVTNG